MKRRKPTESKDERIQNKLNFISKLYNLIFENKSKIATYKQDLNFINDETELVMCCQKIANQIKVFKQRAEIEQDEDYIEASRKLKEIFVQIVNLIKEEFRTIRTRNNRIPQLDVLLMN